MDPRTPSLLAFLCLAVCSSHLADGLVPDGALLILAAIFGATSRSLLVFGALLAPFIGDLLMPVLVAVGHGAPPPIPAAMPDRWVLGDGVVPLAAALAGAVARQAVLACLSSPAMERMHDV